METVISTQSPFSEESLKAMGALAYDHYQNRQYEEALSFFKLLTLFQPQERKHWMGLGATQQMLKDYSNAINTYSHAAFLNENDPYVHLHAAECCYALNDLPRAMIALKSSMAVARQSTQHLQLLQQLNLLEELWHKKVSEGGDHVQHN